MGKLTLVDKLSIKKSRIEEMKAELLLPLSKERQLKSQIRHILDNIYVIDMDLFEKDEDVLNCYDSNINKSLILCTKYYRTLKENPNILSHESETGGRALEPFNAEKGDFNRNGLDHKNYFKAEDYVNYLYDTFMKKKN
jgi:hypothetical protein